MGAGDMTVVGMVGETHIIEDIGVIVPRGVAITIPGHLTLISKDLHRAISQRFLMRIYEAPTSLRVTSGLAKEERERYEVEVRRLTTQVEALTGRNSFLESKVEALQKEVSDLRSKDTKLDEILSAIQERPVQETVSGSVVVRPVPEEKVDGDAPMFIPSTIKPDNVEERVAVQETTSSSSVSTAASKLKALRKNKS